MPGAACVQVVSKLPLQTASMQDGLLELVAVNGVVHLGQLQASQPCIPHLDLNSTHPSRQLTHATAEADDKPSAPSSTSPAAHPPSLLPLTSSHPYHRPRGLLLCPVGQVGLSKAVKICQCSEVTITTARDLPMQIDGEPWGQPKGTIKISRKLDPVSNRMIGEEDAVNCADWWGWLFIVSCVRRTC